MARFPTKYRGRPSRWRRGRPPPPPSAPGAARRSSERGIWRCSFRVPPESVSAFWWALVDDALSVSAFEEEDGNGDGGGLWRVELLHEGPPDRAALERQLAAVTAEHGLPPVELGCEPVPPTDWLTEVARRFPPTRIGRFFIHGREHAAEPPPADTIPLQIEAGQAFGSGEHATTRGCLLALDSLARRRRLRRVLDLGCGSGVLAIAAAKAWPARVVAADIDPVAVVVAAENAALNGVDGRVRAVESDGYAHPLIAAFGPYDLVLANLLADLHRELARDLARCLGPDGVAVLSGVLDRQADAVVAAHWPYGLRLRRTIAIGPWATLVLARTRGR